MHVPFFIGVWLSLVERYVRDVEVAGSNPVTPIFLLGYRKALSLGFAVFFIIKYILILSTLRQTLLPPAPSYRLYLSSDPTLSADLRPEALRSPHPLSVR